MLSLRSFHVFLVLVSIALSAGVGAWTLTHRHPWIGVLFLAVGILLILYLGYFARRVEETHFD